MLPIPLYLQIMGKVLTLSRVQTTCVGGNYTASGEIIWSDSKMASGTLIETETCGSVVREPYEVMVTTEKQDYMGT